MFNCKYKHNFKFLFKYNFKYEYKYTTKGGKGRLTVNTHSFHCLRIYKYNLIN